VIIVEERKMISIKEAAESDEPFCWFILGSLYLNGKPELPKDPILAKYWITKAADSGYKDAVVIKELQWGDNPEGFVGVLADRLESNSKWRRWIGIGVIVLVVIAAIVLFII
jgi:TPR repeat protein